MPMKKLCLWCGLLLFGAAGGLFGTESYSSLMEKAEKMTLKRYDPKSRAFKIKSRELDDILESKEPREKKIRRLKDFIREMEEEQISGNSQAGRSDDPLRKLKADAEKGNPEALYQLGVIYWEGRLQVRSFTRALQCLPKPPLLSIRNPNSCWRWRTGREKASCRIPAKLFHGLKNFIRRDSSRRGSLWASCAMRGPERRRIMRLRNSICWPVCREKRIFRADLRRKRFWAGSIISAGSV